jgi:hypothetical protein
MPAHGVAKDPSEASLGSCTHVYPARTLGGFGSLKRPAFVDLELIVLWILYQIAHSERRWKSGMTAHNE